MRGMTKSKQVIGCSTALQKALQLMIGHLAANGTPASADLAPLTSARTVKQQMD